jgi:hypothetical protein
MRIFIQSWKGIWATEDSHGLADTATVVGELLAVE